MIPLPIANGFYKSSSLPLSAQECVNYFPVVAEAPALSQEVLFATPGIDLIDDGASGVAGFCRGGHNFQNTAWFVIGGTLCEVDSNTTITPKSLGALGYATTPVSMADNGTQLMILDPGGDGWISTGGNPSKITDVDFTANGDPQIVEFIDGYFVCTTDAKKFIISDLGDGTSWNSADFGSAEADPDDIVAPIVFKNELFIAGTQTIESFQNIGGSDFPFVRTGFYIDKGCSAPFSIVKGNDTFIWIGAGENESPSVYSFQGSGAVRISNDAIDGLLGALAETEISNITSWYYGQDGFFFAGFNLPDTTIVYDLKNERWHERKSTFEDANDNLVTTRWRAEAIVSVPGLTIVGDTNGTSVGSLCNNTFSEYGEPIRRSFVTQPFQNNMQSMRVPVIELTCESGVGNATESDPQIEMERSMDGKTWSQPRPRSVGAQGEYGQRQIWYKNGRASRFELFRFSTAAKAKSAVLQLTADIRPGR